MFTILKQALDNRELVELTADDDYSKFEVGYILSLSEEIVVIREVTISGAQGAIKVFHLDDVRTVCDKSSYLLALSEKMLDHKHDNSTEMDTFKSWGSCLSLVKEKKHLCTLYVEDNFYEGYVESVADFSVSLQVVKRDGRYNGNCEVSLKFLDSVEFDGPN